jgi:hypothetical protein
LARKACQGQTLFYAKSKKFYNIGPWTWYHKTFTVVINSVP